MLTKQENIGGKVIYDAVMMGKVCHTIVGDMGEDNVFLGRNKEEKDRE